MASSLSIASGSPTDGVNDNTTRYTSFGGQLRFANLEAGAQVPVRDAGTVNNLYSYVSTNTASVTSTLTLRVSLADTALTVSYTADQTGIKEDTTNSVTVAATDELDWEVTVPTEAGTNTITFSVISGQFNHTSATSCISFMVAEGLHSHVLASQTAYVTANGHLDHTTTEAQAKLRIKGNFTASNLYASIDSNARTTDTTFTTRKIGATGGQTFTYTSAQTGVKEDTTGTDTLVDGDDYNYGITTGTGTEAIQTRVLCSRLVNTDSQFILMAGNPAGQAQAFNVTNYFEAGGSASGAGTTEATFQMLSRMNFTARELQVYVSANTIATSATVVTTRVNGANSVLTLSIAAGATGLQADSVNAAAVNAGTDELSHQVVTPNTSGSLTFIWIALLCDTNPLYIYLPSTGAAAVSPTFDANWEETGDAVRLAMVTTKITSAMTTKSITAVATAQDLLFLQYVSDTLAAQTLAGPISIQMRTAEALATADAFCRMALKVISEDGATVRATLLAFADFGSGTEWNTALRNQIFAFQDQITSYTCILGDRLLLELGCNHAAAAVSLSVSHGDDNASDFAENDETQTTALNPWLKFYKRVTFESTNPEGSLLGGKLLRGGLLRHGVLVRS